MIHRNLGYRGIRPVAQAMSMIPKTEFVKLRKYVLAHLKRNSDANGYCHIQHGSLQSIIIYAKDLRPFAGMHSSHREAATSRFWQALLNAKQVEMVMVPVSLSGCEDRHYHLPGTKPFHHSSEALFEAVRNCDIETAEDIVLGDSYANQNIPEGK